MYDVELAPLAESDLQIIADYFLQTNEQAGVSFGECVGNAIEQLSGFPESAPRCRNKKLARKGYRVLVLDYDYLLFYKIKNKTVLIYRIIHGKMNYIPAL